MKTQGHTRGPTAGPGAAPSGEGTVLSATANDDNESAAVAT
jgi:hypothetical protein